MTMRCDCGDTECPSCGTMQGTYQEPDVFDRIVDRNEALWDLLNSSPSQERAEELIGRAFGSV